MHVAVFADLEGATGSTRVPATWEGTTSAPRSSAI